MLLKRTLRAKGIIFSPASFADLALGRGFGSHEQWPEVGLIHMNARLYDPVTGSFLSPDPEITDKENPQAYNRYANHPSNPMSAHKVENGARALDISSINGVPISKDNPYASTMQDIIKATPGYLENYGPLIINKVSNGSVIQAPWARDIPGGHYDHIHISVPR